MHEKTRPAGGEPAGLTTGGAFAGFAPYDASIAHPHIIRNLPDLAAEAKRKAASCAALAASCRSARDRAGFWRWRRLALLHQAIQHQAGAAANGS